MWLKIAINAVKLPEFETVNRKLWSPGTTVVKDLRQRSRLAWFCACAESSVVFNTGPYTVLAGNSICLNRSTINYVQWTGKSGSGISNMCEKIDSPLHKSRDTAHAQWLQRIVNGILWEISELVTQELIAVGSSNLVEGLTMWLPCMTLAKVKRSKAKVTRSRNVSATITL